MTRYSENRLDSMFQNLRDEGRAGLGIFITAGDPDPETSLNLFQRLPDAGADMVELGIPFSDPMADGPVIQASSQRALKEGMTVTRTLYMVKTFREKNQTTPIVLMGYFNPIYNYGVDGFLCDAIKAGADGLIVVDLPPEEDSELCLPANEVGLPFIRLATPTTDDTRLRTVLRHTSGFVYYVSIAGITGTKEVPQDLVQQAVSRLRKHTHLPVAVGFGINTPQQAAGVARIADSAIVGSAVVSIIKHSLDAGGRATANTVFNALSLVEGLAEGVREARK